jgi:threonine/homoserine efflux transporter RhtA
MNATIVQAIVRHLLTTVGGGFLMSFGLTGGTLDAVVGALSTLAGVAWSLYDKRGQQSAVQQQPNNP